MALGAALAEALAALAASGHACWRLEVVEVGGESAKVVRGVEPNDTAASVARAVNLLVAPFPASLAP